MIILENLDTFLENLQHILLQVICLDSDWY